MEQPEESIFDIIDEEADEAAMLEGEADIAAGRCVPHELVKEWLMRVGTPDHTPMPEEWYK
jgi:predicted transcriptional regulator